MQRHRILKKSKQSKGPIAYWMSRDQRSANNWALNFAQKLAIRKKSPLLVFFYLDDNFLGATYRQYSFMLEGLEEVHKNLLDKNIPFIILESNLEEIIPQFIFENNISNLVVDFDPLKIKRKWIKAVLDKIDVSTYQVDAHNIVPTWLASDKQEYAARTFRPKIWSKIGKITDVESIEKHPYSYNKIDENIDFSSILKKLDVDRSVSKVKKFRSGEREAKKTLDYFIVNKLDEYSQKRNDPILDFQSNLSPYLHFGQISAQKIAYEVQNSDADESSSNAYLEELIVRRELSDNFCYYNQGYDNINSFPNWAKTTLDEHVYDGRDYIYSLEEFENSKTHDDLWNAAQYQMVKEGKMHGYMRMYWAKKILEWTNTPKQAMNIAIYLNDKYELDGRDPNGYAGIAWSIGGIHDRAWGERKIFGKVRYMSLRGAKSKFRVKKYIQKFS